MSVSRSKNGFPFTATRGSGLNVCGTGLGAGLRGKRHKIRGLGETPYISQQFLQVFGSLRVKQKFGRVVTLRL